MDLQIPVAPFQWFWALAVTFNCVVLADNIVHTIRGKRLCDEKECLE